MIDKIRIAYHEAGHAVVYEIFNKRFIFVSIKPDVLDWGRVRPDKRTMTMHKEIKLLIPNHPIYYRDVERCFKREQRINIMTQIYFAGMIAEDIYLKRRVFIKRREEHEDVLGLLKRALINPNEPNELKYYWKWLFERTKNILLKEDNWASVKALAEALLEKETLKYKEAIKIIWDAK